MINTKETVMKSAEGINLDKIINSTPEFISAGRVSLSRVLKIVGNIDKAVITHEAIKALRLTWC